MRKLIPLFIILLWSSIGWSTIYYVDNSCTNAGDGTAQTCAASPGAAGPWKTIASVNGATFVPDDQVLFHKGQTWVEKLIPPSSGTSNHPIIFSSYSTGVKPKIDGTGVDACVYDDTGKEYITIDGFEFISPTLYGVLHNRWLAGPTPGSTPNWTVQNCTFTGCGLYMFGPNTIIQDNVFVGPSPAGAYHGGVIVSGAVNSNCQVLRNTISGYNYRGIWIGSQSTNPTVNDNIIHDVGSISDGFGIDIDGAGDYGVTGGTVNGNTVYNCASHCIALENNMGAPTVKYNLVHDCGPAEDGGFIAGIFIQNYTTFRSVAVNGVVAYNVAYNVFRGIHIYEASHYGVWNNVLYGGLAGTYFQNATGLLITDTGSYVSNIDVRNNIVNSNFSRSIVVPAAWETYLSQFDYNILVDGVPAITESDIPTDRTLASLQAVGKCPNCSSVSPSFAGVSNSNFRLLPNSPAINTGIAITQDISYLLLETGDKILLETGDDLVNESTSIWETLVRDYENKYVPFRGSTDIGAFEWQGLNSIMFGM